MHLLFTPPKLKTYAGLFVNISAAYFVGAAVSPNLTYGADKISSILLILQNIFFGVLYLLVAIEIEEYLYGRKFS